MLDEPIRRVESAKNELTKATNSASAWSDAQRQQFDSDRLKPLYEAAARLQMDLRKAAQQCDTAQKLLG